MRTVVAVAVLTLTAGVLNAATIHADVAEFAGGPDPLAGCEVER